MNYERRILVSNAVNGVGGGLWFTIWALFLTRIVGIPAGRMGLALAIAGLAGLACALPVGALADRHGAKRVLVLLYLVRGLACLAFLGVTGLPALIVVAAVFNGAQIVGMGVGNALIAGLFEGPARMRMLARSRAVVHAANTAGAALGAIVLTLDQRWAYVAAIVFNAVTFLATSALLGRLPEVATTGCTARWAGLPGTAIRDLSYLSVMAPVAALALCWAMLSTGVPLWVSERTAAPIGAAAAMVVLSSLLIALLQVPVSARIGGARRAATAATAAGVLLAASCVILIGATGHGALIAAVVVALAVLVHVAGELLFVAGQWELSMSLMDEDLKGEYQGLNATLTGVVMTFAPALVSGLVGGLGATGWALLAGIFLACAVPVLPAARRQPCWGLSSARP